ncbi:MAG: enoyl-CoA hydratase/isomerase family protein [Chloroflexi bacterium]|nr:enoyl-CoA hydratase/isomerase family protein [Chloroflexota bacterium]
MVYQNILVDIKDGVGLVTLNRPDKLNALNFPLVSELDQAVTQMEASGEVRALVVTGAGERAFSAGADIHEMTGLSQEERDRRQEARSGYSWRLADCRMPTIGAINGIAYGGGALMSSSFDLRVGCERTRFRFLAATYGRVNSTWTLPLLVGWPVAKELLFTGREVGPEEALRIGLLNRLVPAERVVEEAMELARLIARNDPRMVQGIKRLLHQGLGQDYQGRFVVERDARTGVLKETPPQEGFKEFLARKGQPGRPES